MTTASVAAACLLATPACGGDDLVLPGNAEPAAIEALSGNDQVAPAGAELPAPIRVSVTDTRGRPVGGVRVAFDPEGPGAGSTSPDTAMTNGDGEASARWVLGEEIGEQLVRVEVVGADLDVVSFTATAVSTSPAPSAAHSSVVAEPAEIEAGTGHSVITVTVRDGQGDPVPGVHVTLAASGSGNQLTQPDGPTDEDGVAQGMLRATVAGERIVSAVVDGSLAIQQTASVRVTAAPVPVPDRLRFVVQPSDAIEDQPIAPPVAVALVDERGDVVPLSGVAIRLELIHEHHHPNDLDGRTEQVTDEGVATFPDLAADRHHKDYRLRASAPDHPELGTVDSEPFDVED